MNPPIGATNPATPAKERRLGRGLASLISIPPSPPPTAVSAVPGHPQSMLANIDLAAISANPDQPRKVFDESALTGLAESIRTNGIIQPIVIRRLPDGAGPSKYQLVAGERRWRAAKLAGLTSIPAIVKTLDDTVAMEISLLENLQRQDLNPMDRAGAYDVLLRRTGMSQEQLAKRLGEGRPTISNHLALLGLPESVRQMLGSGKLSFGHGRALCALKNRDNQVRLAERIAQGDVSVNELQRRISELIGDDPIGEDKLMAHFGLQSPSAPVELEAAVKAEPPPKPANIVALEEKLTRRLGTRVDIRPGRRPDMGKMVIDFYCLDDFDRILDALGVAAD